jgi:hypothetical protein
VNVQWTKACAHTQKSHIEKNSMSVKERIRKRDLKSCTVSPCEAAMSVKRWSENIFSYVMY